MNIPIPFNKPYFSGNETRYIEQTVRLGKIPGDGMFTRRVHDFFEQQLVFQKVLLTTSCTDALEMAALLLDIEPGDEVIVPVSTFVSTANAFVLGGATEVFADSTAVNFNLDAAAFESLVTYCTRAIVPVHYAGIAFDMDAVLAVAARHRLVVVEDAAPAIDSSYRGQSLSTSGTLAAFSSHETKNIISGEGRLLAINDDWYGARTKIIREKGTTRSTVFWGEADKYGWVDVGSLPLPPDIIAAYLWAQLENLADIQQRRRAIWARYYAALAPLGVFGVCWPVLPDYATNNGHLFYLVCYGLPARTALIAHLKSRGIWAVFHYLPLHQRTYTPPDMTAARCPRLPTTPVVSCASRSSTS